MRLRAYFRAEMLGDVLAVGVKVGEIVEVGKMDGGARRQCQRRDDLVAQAGIGEGNNVHHRQLNRCTGDDVAAVVPDEHLIRAGVGEVHAGEVAGGAGRAGEVGAVELPLIVEVGERGGGDDVELDFFTRRGNGVDGLLDDADGAAAVGVANIQAGGGGDGIAGAVVEDKLVIGLPDWCQRRTG